MSKPQSLISSAVLFAAMALAAGAACAAPSGQAVVTLPQVVITGKAVQVQQLPRVVVTGYSIEGQLRRQMLAQAGAKAGRRS